MCYPICGMVHIKDPLLLIRKSSPYNGDIGFLVFLLRSPLLFVQCHITMNKKFMSVTLNKIFPSFLAKIAQLYQCIHI